MQPKTKKWLRKLWDTLVMTDLKTAKQRLAALASRLKRYNGENKACIINKLFPSDVSKIYTQLKNGNQSVEEPDPPKKK